MGALPKQGPGLGTCDYFWAPVRVCYEAELCRDWVLGWPVIVIVIIVLTLPLVSVNGEGGTGEENKEETAALQVHPARSHPPSVKHSSKDSSGQVYC